MARTYRQCFFAFIDILGFRTLIENLQPSDVGSFANILRQALTAGGIEANGEERVKGYYTKIFSDTVTISVSANWSTPLQFLLRVAHFQAALAFRGIFVRGAAVLGQHFEDNTILFGPALIQAVDLERTVAKWPRIVIHPSVVSVCIGPRASLSTQDLEKERTETLLRQDADGMRYLNYLRFFYEECDCQKRREFLSCHRDYIVEGARRNSANLAILVKYYWLATYHNNEVNKLGHLDCQVEISSTFQGL